MGHAPPSVSIVVPCYNEAAVIDQTATRLTELIKDLRRRELVAPDSRLCMVDDGSTDQTWAIIRRLASTDPTCSGLRLSRNFGHQHALLAGLLSAPGDVLVSMDADLQDDPAVLEEMLHAHAGGADIVYGVRARRTSDTWLKRWTAAVYYRLLRWMGVRILADHADYRLMSRRAVEALRGHGEVNLFLRGLIPRLGFRQATVFYDRLPRAGGETKYSLGRMLALAVDGITSFSAVPLRLIALIGIVVFLGSLGLTAWALGIRLLTDQAIPGWASSVLPMYFLGGIQLLSLAVVGEYVSKIYLEAKARPRFLVQEAIRIRIPQEGGRSSEAPEAARGAGKSHALKVPPGEPGELHPVSEEVPGTSRRGPQR
jgi:polyisoprenyl-phosphate glycosyltransferase